MNKIILKRMAERIIDNLPLEEEANAIMQAEDFREYISENGYHFNCKLADYVTANLLINADGTRHNWTSEQVKNALGMPELPQKHTWGDAAYAANWIYSDYYPALARTEGDVISHTKRFLTDPDGYEGMFFMRFLSDLIGKKQNVDWSRFV